jgi:hypothetical protein
MVWQQLLGALAGLLVACFLLPLQELCVKHRIGIWTKNGW